MSPMSSKSLNLKIFRDDQLVEHKTIAEGVVKIGRLESSHLRLDDASVARMHAVIEIAGSDVRVIDLGSATGTLLNGRRVHRNAVLKHGDALAFGPYRVEIGVAELPVQARAAGRATGRASAEIATALATPERAVASRPALRIDPREVEVDDGRCVTEVTAMYGDTVLDVQHVGQVEARRSSAPALIALGGLMLLGGGVFFAADVVQDWEGHRARVEAASEAGRPMPAEPGTGWGSLGIAIAFLGLVPLGVGAVRMREVGLLDYTIGEGHGATLHVSSDGLPDAEGFSLVRGGDGGSSIAFTPDMIGDVTIGGQTTTLAELAQAGHAGVGGTHVHPLPPGAQARIAHGGLTFHISSVARARLSAGRSEADKPFWLYNAGSVATLGALLVLMHLVPEDALAMGLDDRVADNRFVGFMNAPDEIPQEDPIVEEVEHGDEAAGGEGQRHAGEEGKAGKPTAKSMSGLQAVKGSKDRSPQLARNFDPEAAARKDGILGLIEQESGHFLASPFGGAFAAGQDDEDVWGGLHGTEVGEAHGVGGIGLVGTGRGGGGMGEGTVGFGNVGTMGHGGGGGSGTGYGPGRGRGTAFGARKQKAPVVRAAMHTTTPGLDKDVVRRVVRNHINEVRYCYNQGLARDPNLTGRVSVQFRIGPTGQVPIAVVQESSLGDRSAANCIAAAVKRWRFPKPQGGGTVMVTYPFVLQPG
jgi:hypothetical protein